MSMLREGGRGTWIPSVQRADTVSAAQQLVHGTGPHNVIDTPRSFEVFDPFLVTSKDCVYSSADLAKEILGDYYDPVAIGHDQITWSDHNLTNADYTVEISRRYVMTRCKRGNAAGVNRQLAIDNLLEISHKAISHDSSYTLDLRHPRHHAPHDAGFFVPGSCDDDDVPRLSEFERFQGQQFIGRRCQNSHCGPHNPACRAVHGFDLKR